MRQKAIFYPDAFWKREKEMAALAWRHNPNISRNESTTTFQFTTPLMGEY